MGNLLSSYQRLPNNQLNELLDRLEKIENIDKNHDGIISKDEFEEWKNNDLQRIKESIKDEVRQEYNGKIANFKHEVKSLKSANKELEKSLLEKNSLIQKLGENIQSDEDVDQLMNMLSQEQINRYVDELLADEKTNIKYLPDFVERQIYRNIFRLSLKLMNKIMNSMSFEIINHRLHLNMIPQQD